MKPIEKQLDDLWQKAVKKRDNHRCQFCYNQGIDAHHLIHRTHKILRWNIQNGICVCRECHRLIHDGKRILRIPDELIELKHKTVKYSTDDLEKIKEVLKDYVKKEESNGG